MEVITKACGTAGRYRTRESIAGKWSACGSTKPLAVPTASTSMWVVLPVMRVSSDPTVPGGLKWLRMSRCIRRDALINSSSVGMRLLARLLVVWERQKFVDGGGRNDDAVTDACTVKLATPDCLSYQPAADAKHFRGFGNRISPFAVFHWFNLHQVWGVALSNVT